MLFENLQKASLEAMKQRDKVKKDILSSVISKCKYKIVELRSENKELSDDDVLKVIEKTVKELNEEIDAFKKAPGDHEERINSLTSQREYLITYLPKKLTEEEIREIINTLDDKSMPNIMKHFKQNYTNTCDMALVNKIARSL